MIFATTIARRGSVADGSGLLIHATAQAVPCPAGLGDDASSPPAGAAPYDGANARPHGFTHR
jgi:hypothetical protein